MLCQECGLILGVDKLGCQRAAKLAAIAFIAAILTYQLALLIDK